MELKVLGSGCAKCQQLYAAASQAVAKAGVQASLVKVEKLDEIMKYGVMMTPALVVNGQVKCSGRLANVDEIVGWLSAGSQG